MNEKNTRYIKNVSLFVGCSLIGIILFLIPVKMNGNSDLLIAVIANGITSVIGPVLPYVLSAIFAAGTILAVIHWFRPIKALNTNPLLKESYELTSFKLVIRILGTVFFIMCTFQIGPEFIISGATGGTLYSLMLTLAAWHIVSFYLFSFLMDFGAMDFVGTLIKNVMRPVFTLPGNSAIDCMASWVGNGPFGVIVTKMQYQEGYYTKRESAVVASCFSIVSISFCTIVARTLGIIDKFGPYYLSITITTILCALILPRIWPLNQIADTYNPEAPKRYDTREKGHLYWQAVKCGADKAGEADFGHIIKRCNQTALDFLITVFPTMMAYGTLLLMVSVYTPVIQEISMPVKWILALLEIPEATAAAPALLTGFIDMYLPAVAGSSITSQMTRFIIGSVSIGQLIYMTETGSIILKNREIFELPLWKLIVIFLMRTVISLCVAVLMAKIIF